MFHGAVTVREVTNSPFSGPFHACLFKPHLQTTWPDTSLNFTHPTTPFSPFFFWFLSSVSDSGPTHTCKTASTLYFISTRAPAEGCGQPMGREEAVQRGPFSGGDSTSMVHNGWRGRMRACTCCIVCLCVRLFVWVGESACVCVAAHLCVQPSLCAQQVHCLKA